MESKERYLQFPLFLIRELFIDKEKAINNIIRYGIYHFSKRQKYEMLDVSKQIMYGYYRGGLSNDLKKTVSNYVDEEKIDIDGDYSGFNGSIFNPETEIGQLLKIFETDNDFKEKAIIFYQIKQAYSFLGINGNYEDCLRVGKQIEKTVPEHEPFPMVSKSLLFEFRDKNKSESDLAQFAAYIAVRSILGKKSNCKTNKKMIVCRIFGYSSIKHLPNNFKPGIKELFTKYSNRYHIDRILQYLELNWKVITYSNNIRGLYVAIIGDKMNIDTLAIIAETKKKKNQINSLKKKKDEAREKALQQLN